MPRKNVGAVVRVPDEDEDFVVIERKSDGFGGYGLLLRRRFDRDAPRFWYSEDMLYDGFPEAREANG